MKKGRKTVLNLSALLFCVSRARPMNWGDIVAAMGSLKSPYSPGAQ